MRRTRRAGFTMIELLLAVGLFSLLLVALLKLVDTSMTIWQRTDDQRELGQASAAVMELFSEDLQALEGGARGDLLAEWVLQDTDGDGIEGMPRARLRLVRHMGAAGLQRLAKRAPGEDLETFERGRVEVVWALLPSEGRGDERAAGRLVRGERLLEDDATLSFFDAAYFGASGKPAPGSTAELTAGVLWFEPWFASQTSVLHDGWSLGDTLADCGASWDAWTRARPDAERSLLNRPATGMPTAKDVPLLPRRVRLALELERTADLRLRTTLAAELGPESTSFLVRDGRKLPEPGRFLMLGDEWMELRSVDGDRVGVTRGQRGTRALLHPAGALVHFGHRTVREVPVDLVREDWDL
jgi:prepilin-type N-terminal cleavage/methylation domain-containing protein